MIFYELWDKTSRNLLGSYATQQEAVAAAARLVAQDPPSLARLTLDWGDDDDEDAGGLIAEGIQVGELIRDGDQRSSTNGDGTLRSSYPATTVKPPG